MCREVAADGRSVQRTRDSGWSLECRVHGWTVISWDCGDRLGLGVWRGEVMFVGECEWSVEEAMEEKENWARCWAGES